MSVTVSNPTSNLSGATLVLIAGTHTITGSWTFSRSPSAPFTVTAGSAKVTNLDADKLDGLDSTSFVTIPVSADLTFTDATYDIGKTGATRPRDLFLSRNAVVGGTLGVTGASTLTGIATFTAAPAVSAGVQFPAAQAASSDVNNLDDYEEGSWTPVLGGSGGTSGQTYATQVGKYVKIGKMVIANFSVTLSVKGTITTSAQIQGLPFTSENIAGLQPTYMLFFDTLATNWVALFGVLNVNDTTLTIRGSSTAAASTTVLTTTDIGGSTSIRGSIAYTATA